MAPGPDALPDHDPVTVRGAQDELPQAVRTVGREPAAPYFFLAGAGGAIPLNMSTT